MSAPHRDVPEAIDGVLIPFHGLEAITIQQASYRTGIQETTLRRWTRDFGLGGRLAG